MIGAYKRFHQAERRFHDEHWLASTAVYGVLQSIAFALVYGWIGLWVSLAAAVAFIVVVGIVKRLQRRQEQTDRPSGR